MSNARRYDISFIRAAAILLVMLGHSLIIYSSGWDLYSTAVSVLWIISIEECVVEQSM